MPADVERQVVHRDLSLTVYRGEILSLVGGSGKNSNASPLGVMRTYAHLEPGQEFGYRAWIEAENTVTFGYLDAGGGFASNGVGGDGGTVTVTAGNGIVPAAAPAAQSVSATIWASGGNGSGGSLGGAGGTVLLTTANGTIDLAGAIAAFGGATAGDGGVVVL